MQNKIEIPPLISIVVPVYNTERYLKKCLESLQKQSYEKIEIIIVNDGSPDNSEIIIEQFLNNDSRFKYMKKPNGGLSSARNMGIDNAQGDYLAFVDSDDWVSESYISDLYNNIGDSEIAIGTYTLVDTVLKRNYKPCQKGWGGKRFSSDEKNMNILINLLGPSAKDKHVKKPNYQLMPVWKNLYKMSLINENHLRFTSERDIMLEDYFFNIQAYYYANSIYITDSTAYQHVIVEGSLSRKYRANLYQMMNNLYAVTINFLKENTDLNEVSYMNSFYNFILKTTVDTLYNASVLPFNQFKDVFIQVRNSRYQVDSFDNYSKGVMPFYYKYFILLIKNRKIKKLYRRYMQSRRMNYYYRLYRSIFKKY